jgi:hypothetical protein
MARMATSTRTDWTRYLNWVEAAWGDHPVKALEPFHVLDLRDRYADIPPAPPAILTKPVEDYRNRPAAADNLLRALSAMLSWAVPRGWRSDNPCDKVPKFASEIAGDGYAAWTRRAIRYFEKHASPHLWWVAAYAIYTGQRQGDVLVMLRSHVRDGVRPGRWRLGEAGEDRQDPVDTLAPRSAGRSRGDATTIVNSSAHELPGASLDIVGISC